MGLDTHRFVLDSLGSGYPIEKWQETVNAMARICRTPAAFIVQYSPDGYQVMISSQQSTNPYSAGGVIPADTNIFCKKVVGEQIALYVNDAQLDRI